MIFAYFLPHDVEAKPQTECGKNTAKLKFSTFNYNTALIQRPEFCKGMFKTTSLAKESHLNSADIPKIESNLGYVINYLLFLPAAGYRNDNGQLNRRGNDGFYWSSNIQSGDRVYDLWFNNGNATATDHAYRTNGFSVRCVAALKKRINKFSHAYWVTMREQRKER